MAEHYDHDVAIIGSGLGGLVCGAILSMNGYKVSIFEKNRQIGGCLQTFSRDKTILDTGVHYIGALAQGQQLYKIFKYLGIYDKLKLQRLDMDGFDHITFDGDECVYKLAQGYENFITQLVRDFPDEEPAIRTYCEKIREVCAKFPLYNLRTGDYAEKRDVLDIPTCGYLASVTGNRKLQQVLAGNNMLYAGEADKTPFYIHALVTNSYIESAWKCVDGGSQIAKLLGRCITDHGGDIYRNTEVVRIVEEDGRANKIVKSNGTEVTARFFISNLHPTQTTAMTRSNLLRGAFRQRMERLENTMGAFLVNVVLKKDTFPYLNHNHYHHKSDNAWEGIAYTEESWPQTYALFVGAGSKSAEYADNLTIMTYMSHNDVAKWAGTFNTDSCEADRGSDYEAFKQTKAERLLDLVSEQFPTLRSCIASYYVATPLTYRDYQGTTDGSMYGVAKDHQSTFTTFIAPATRIPNLYLTGQNLNLHGILGVTISALMTCAELTDIEQLLSKINNT